MLGTWNCLLSALCVIRNTPYSGPNLIRHSVAAKSTTVQMTVHSAFLLARPKDPSKKTSVWSHLLMNQPLANSTIHTSTLGIIVVVTNC